MRFFYYYPTWEKPSGGNKQIRLTASLLADAGVETFLLRDQRYFRQSVVDDDVFYGVPVPVAPFPFEEARGHLRPDDVLLLPEVLLKESLKICDEWDCRLALNNQNGFYGLRYSPGRRACSERFEFAVANAPYVAALCNKFMGISAQRIFIVPHWIVRSPFEPDSADPYRTPSVCYMPRKLSQVVSQIRNAVQETHPHVPWIEIDGLPEVEVARIYQKSSIFFAAQDLEGCPMTSLEAMSCGCLVTGFAGTARFPHPYSTAKNGIWVPDRNVSAAIRGVQQAIDLTSRNGPIYKSFLQEGRKTANRFTREAVMEALEVLLKTVDRRSYASREAVIHGLGLSGHLFAYKLLYDYESLGWAGKALSRVSDATKPVRRAICRGRLGL